MGYDQRNKYLYWSSELNTCFIVGNNNWIAHIGDEVKYDKVIYIRGIKKDINFMFSQCFWENKQNSLKVRLRQHDAANLLIIQGDVFHYSGGHQGGPCLSERKLIRKATTRVVSTRNVGRPTSYKVAEDGTATKLGKPRGSSQGRPS